MSRRDDGVALRQMHDHIEEAVAVDCDILWEIITGDFPPLLRLIGPLLSAT